jgi:hypothetical protein
MITQFLNWQFVLLTSKMDGEMPMRGRERIYEKISFHGKTQPRKVQSNTARSKQVFGLYPIEKTSEKDRIIKAYGKSFQKMKSGPLWDEQFHLNGQ